MRGHDRGGRVVDLLVLHAALFVTVVALTPSSEILPNHGDVLLYFQYAERLTQGEIPYRDIPVEYPPLAMLAFVLPYLAWPPGTPSFETYQWLFLVQSALLSTAVALGVGWVGSRIDPRHGMLRGVTLYTVMVAFSAPLLAWRYDLLPAALSLAGLAFALAGRPALSGAAIGLGFAAKVFPIVLLPVLCLYVLVKREWGAAGRLLAGFAAAAALIWLPITIVAPEEVLSFATRQQVRPIQIESIQGGLHLLTHLVFGTDIQLSFDFGSVNVRSAGAEQALGLGVIVTLGALAGALALFLLRFVDETRLRGSPSARTLVDASVAILLVLMVTNKVFSPQYIIWLLPFAALLGRAHAYLVVIATTLTLIIFPLNYERLVALEPALIIVLNLRNLVLILLLALLLMGPSGSDYLRWIRSRARI